MHIIVAENLSKVYPVAVKEPGLKGTLLHFLRRTYRLQFLFKLGGCRLLGANAEEPPR